MQWIPGDYASKLSSGLVSSSGPDVFEFHPDVQMAKSGQVVPLDDIVADVKSDFTETIWPPTRWTARSTASA